MIFDLDGTLVDSYEDIAVSVNRAIERAGLNSLDLETIYSYIGEGLSALLIKATGREDPEFIKQVKEYFNEDYSRNMMNSTTLYPGVEETINALSKENTLFVLSNKPLRFVEPLVAHLGLAPFIKKIYAPPMFDRVKPDPQGIHMVLEEHSLIPESTYMIGDNYTDIEAGKSAGVHTVFCRFGHGKESTFIKPDHIIESFRDIAGIL